MARRSRWCGLLLVFGSLACGVVAAEGELSSRSAILAAADAEVERLGFDPDTMSVAFDAGNRRWAENANSFWGLSQWRAVHEDLKDRDYLALYYAPLATARGGELWIFLDRQTLKAITVFQGQ